MLKGERAQRRKEKETINTSDHQDKGSREMLLVGRVQNEHLKKERGGDVAHYNRNVTKTQKGRSGTKVGNAHLECSKRGRW